MNKVDRYRGEKVVGVLLLSALLVAACAAVVPQRAQVDLPLLSVQSESGPVEQSIAVTGFGEVAGAPDMATVQFAVEIKAPNMAEALDTSNREVERVMQALVASGIAETDIQSNSFNVWREDVYDPEFGRPTGEQLFHVDNTLAVQVRQLDSLSDTIRIALDAGATNIWGLSYGIDESASLESKARSQALEDAHDRALQLAQTLGVTLGEPIMASELAGGSLLTFGPGGMFERGMGGGGGPPLSPGELSVRIQVDVVYPIDR